MLTSSSVSPNERHSTGSLTTDSEAVRPYNDHGKLTTILEWF